MKMRPQFNLRFRSAEQFTQIQDIAAARGIAVNEWLLRQAEASEDVSLGLAEIAGLNRKSGNETATGIERQRDQGAANLVKAIRTRRVIDAVGDGELGGAGGRGAGVGEVQAVVDGAQGAVVGASEASGGAEVVAVSQMCPYTEYDMDTGENMACGKQEHSGKVKHGNWRKA